MIGQLRGTILEKQAPRIILDVGGVGYEIDAPMTTFYELPETGGEVVLYTHLSVREDAHSLYGFVSKTDRSLFRSLIKISGVGAKLALALLSGMAANDFANTIINKDIGSLVKIPGVGKKTAERLVVEMGDRLKNWQVGASVSPGPQITNNNESDITDNSTQDAISALIALGYKPQQASMMVLKVDAIGISSEEIIRQALKSVAG